MSKNNKKGTPISDGLKLTKHITIIIVLIVIGAVVAHFSLVLFTRHSAHRTVPEFKGLILNEAEYLAADNDLRIVINDSLYAPMYEGGMVLDQLPKSGVGVKPGRTVYVTINAFGVKMVKVPYVAGRSLRQAKNMLEVAGLQIKELVYKPDMATNYVLEEYYGEIEITEESQQEAVVGSGITLYVGMSESNRTTVMPQLIGMTLREAKSRLWELGLNVGRLKLPEDATPHNSDKARVYSQMRPKGEDISLGRAVSLELTFDNEKVDEILEYIAAMERAAEKQRLREEDSLAQIKMMRLSAPQPQQPQTPQIEEDEDDSFFE